MSKDSKTAGSSPVAAAVVDAKSAVQSAAVVPSWAEALMKMYEHSFHRWYCNPNSTNPPQFHKSNITVHLFGHEAESDFLATLNHLFDAGIPAIRFYNLFLNAGIDQCPASAAYVAFYKKICDQLS